MKPWWGRQFVTYAGGKGANQAVAVGRMGARSAMVGSALVTICSGRSWLSYCSLPELKPARWVSAKASSSGIAVISVGEDGQNRIVQVLGANDTCGEAEFDAIAGLLPEASAVLLQLEVSVDLSLRVADLAASQGVSVILDPGPVRPVPAEFYRHVAVITPNETEAEALVSHPVADLDAARAAADELLNRGVGAAVIKLGALGAYWSDGNDWRPCSTVPSNCRGHRGGRRCVQRGDGGCPV